MCISLARNGTFIAASAGSSVSLWDTMTREQIGSIIKFTHDIWFMAITTSDDLVTGGDEKITLRSLCYILPSLGFDVVRQWPKRTRTPYPARRIPTQCPVSQ
ncbi:hypothetical protein OG21DRAFT_900276 [Imleria badia]|nr:hypothetical protein OG21DRAFT_900276 [Imleria badia]